MNEINQQREALQAKVRERERAIESGRQLILRLLGEASTLKNQLAQIDEYLAGIERESGAVEPRGPRPRRRRSSGWRRPGSSSPTSWRQRQLELESVTGERRRTEEELVERRRTAAELRREIDTVKTEVSQIRARKESLEQVLAHRTYTTESVKRLFASLEKGKANELKPLGVLADYVEVDPAVRKAGRRVSSRRAGIRGGGELGTGRARARFHPRRAGRPRHVPGASGAERQRAPPPAGAGHRAGNRDCRAAERLAAPDQRLQRPRGGPAAAGFAVLPGGRPFRGAAACR